jgi:hypothetical protein
MTDKVPAIYRRTLSGFTPANAEADAFWREVPLGKLISLTGKLPRNLDRLRSYWATMRIAADNIEWADGNPEMVHLAIKAALGLGEWITVPGASKPLFREGSISFAKMSEPEFRDFYDKATNVVEKHWLKVPIGSLRQEVEAV